MIESRDEPRQILNFSKLFTEWAPKKNTLKKHSEHDRIDEAAETRKNKLKRFHFLQFSRNS